MLHKYNKRLHKRAKQQISIKESNKLSTELNLNATLTCKDSLDDYGVYDCLFTCSPYSLKEIWNQPIEDKSCDEWIDAFV